MDILLHIVLPIVSSLGIPAIFAGIVLRGLSRVEAERNRRDAIAEAERKRQEKETQAIKLGVQAMLRAQMINEYNKAQDKGYAPLYAKSNFENVYVNYHALGVNGVMDGMMEDYMAMPTRKGITKNDENKLESES